MEPIDNEVTFYLDIHEDGDFYATVGAERQRYAEAILWAASEQVVPNEHGGSWGRFRVTLERVEEE